MPVLILLALDLSNACTLNNGHEDVVTVTTAGSPNNEHVATVYNVSGGGAAGYVYNCVNLRKREEPFESKTGIVFTASGTRRITAVWQDDEHLIIRHSKSAGIYKNAEEWGSDRKIRISYAEEE
jgi:hypothetical protein